MLKRSALIMLSMAIASSFTSAQAQQNRSAEASGANSQASGASGTSQVQLASYGTCYPGGGYSNPNGPKPMAYGPAWPATGNRDCSRFYHYPYVFYPQNFRGNDYYRSSDSMYYRYPPEMQIPVYNKHWHNEYPSARRYHWGHHFLLDVF